MFGRFTRTFANVVPPSVRTNWLTPTFCDDTEEVAPPEQTLDDLAKEIEKAEKEGSALAHTPAKYKEFSGSFMSGMVQTFDGARLIVQKQLNLNTVVSHFYWVGSQAMNNQPVYKYTCILPFSDDKVLNIGTDMDMNLEGEAKVQLDDSLSLKSGFAFGQQGNNYTVDLDYNDASSTAQLWYTQDEQQGGSIYGFGFMQALLKEFALGASMTYIPSQKTTTTSFAGLFDDETNKIALQYGGGQTLFHAHYLRRVNADRVHIGSSLIVNPDGSDMVAVNAEFKFKQSTVHMSFDNHLMIKSTIDNQISPGTNLTISSEISQAKEHYRFGIALIMG